MSLDGQDGVGVGVGVGVEGIQPIVSSWSFASIAQDGQDLEVTSPAVDLQVVDPAITNIGGNDAANSQSQIVIGLPAIASEVTVHLQPSGNLHLTDNLQVPGAAPLYLPVRASVLPSSGTVDRQVSAPFGGLRPYPHTPILWAAYFRDLKAKLPRVNFLLAAFKNTFHPSASLADYLVRVLSGTTSGGAVVNGGMQLMALQGMMQLNDLELLDRVIHLDLSMRYCRSGWTAMRKRREKELAAVEVKARDCEVEKESYQRLKDMYEAESESLDRERSSLNREMNLFKKEKDQFKKEEDIFRLEMADSGYKVMRLGHILGLGVTTEELQADHDLALERLQAILESSIIQNNAQLQMLAHMGLSGGMQLWFARMEELLRHNLDHNVSIQLNVPNRAATIGQSPLAGQLASATKRLAIAEVEIVKLSASHKAAMEDMEAENQKLRKQVEDLTVELRERQTEDAN